MKQCPANFFLHFTLLLLILLKVFPFSRASFLFTNVLSELEWNFRWEHTWSKMKTKLEEKLLFYN